MHMQWVLTGKSPVLVPLIKKNADTGKNKIRNHSDSIVKEFARHRFVQKFVRTIVSGV